jgi:amino acid transporter
MTVFGTAASAPMVVLVGGIVATYAAAQVESLPLLFLVVGAVVALLAVGYTALSQQVPHAAPYYANLARGLGRTMGVSGGALALVAYNTIQISLYGLLGATLSDLAGGQWWVWSALVLLLVAALGVRAIALTTGVLATVLVLSLVVILFFGTASLIDPAEGGSVWQGYSASGLLTSGSGVALALTVAAFMGVESPASFAEEAMDEGAVTRSVFTGVLTLAGVYSVAAWAMGVAVGTDRVAEVAADPAGGLPFSILEQRIGGFMTPLTQAVLIFAIITSLLAFHSVIARYAFAMAREGVLPAALARGGKGTRVSAPINGSVLQSVIAALTLGAFVLADADPFATVFTWLSTLGALGLLTLLVASAAAAIAYFQRDGAPKVGAWTALVAPMLGLAGGLAILGAVVYNIRTLLGAAPDAVAPLLLPLIVVVTVIAGALWAHRLRRTRPAVYQGISQGRPNVHDVPDDVNVSF